MFILLDKILAIAIIFFRDKFIKLEGQIITVYSKYQKYQNSDINIITWVGIQITQFIHTRMIYIYDVFISHISYFYVHKLILI